MKKAGKRACTAQIELAILEKRIPEGEIIGQGKKTTEELVLNVPLNIFFFPTFFNFIEVQLI